MSAAATGEVGETSTASSNDVPPIDLCADAVVLDPADFAPEGEDWRITTNEGAAPLVGAREVAGGFVITGDMVDQLPEFPCLETVGTIWIQKTKLPDLSAFRRLARVTENLKIERNHALVDLGGLDALEEVGGLLDISDNDGLQSYAGFTALRKVGTFSAYQNDGVYDLDAMPPIEAGIFALGGQLRDIKGLAVTSSMAYNVNSAVLESLEGLPIQPKMRTVAIDGGTYDSLAPLAALEECSRLDIAGNEGLQSLDGLQNLKRLVDYDGTPGFLTLSGNADLRDISALSNVTMIESAVEIDDNPELVSLEGLGGFPSTKQIAITANVKLESLAPLQDGALRSVEEYIRVTSNWGLPECQALAFCASFPNATCQVANNDTRSVEGC